MVVFRHIILILIAFPVMGATLIAQDYAVEYIPARFGQYMNQLTWINPAAAGWRGDFEFYTGNQRQGGSWSGVNTYYLNANFRLPGADMSRQNLKNILGLRLHSDREGDFINRNRASGLYAFHTRLTRKLIASGSLSFGFVNYFIQGTAITGNSSVSGMDGDAGFWLYGDGFYFGLSGNQLFNTELQPFTEITRLSRHYHFAGGYTLQILDFLTARASALLRWSQAGTWSADAGLLMLFEQHYGFGANYHIRRGTTFVAGIDQLNLKHGNITAMLSYSLPFASTLLNITTYELCLIYHIDY
jgi:type IX secretion system PorP/SprF family membrane protein